MNLLEDANTSSSELYFRDFPGITVVKTAPSHAGDVGLILGPGATMLLAKKPETIKQKQYCDKLNQDIESDPHLNDLLEKTSSGNITQQVCLILP